MLAVAVAAVGIAACGGDEDPSAPNDAQNAPARERSADTPSPPRSERGKGERRSEDTGERRGSGEQASSDFTPRPHTDSGGGSEQFRTKGGDNSIQEFGAEAGGAEFDRAAVALHNFLDARAQGEWAAACEYLESGVAESLEQFASRSAQGEVSGCAAALERITNPAAAEELRAEAAKADVGSVRLEGERGFVLYRVDGTVFAIPIANEGGAMKVAALAGVPLS